MKFIVVISLFALISVVYAKGYDSSNGKDGKSGSGVSHGHKHGHGNKNGDGKVDGKVDGNGGKRRRCSLVCPKNSKLSKRICSCICNEGFKAVGRTCKRPALGERIIKQKCNQKCQRGQKQVLATCKCVEKRHFKNKLGKGKKEKSQKPGHGHNIGSERESY